MATSTIDSIPSTGFLSINQITSCKAQGRVGILPVARSTWIKGVESGQFPKPVRFGARLVLWKAEDVRLVVENGGALPNFVRKPDRAGCNLPWLQTKQAKKAAKEQAAAA
jgi:prophage regulatory protein